MGIYAEQELKLFNSNDKLIFSLFDMQGDKTLLFIHSPWLSSQLPIDKIGLRATCDCHNIRLEITSMDYPLIHQSWFIDLAELTVLTSYFQSIGFRMAELTPLQYSTPEVLQ